MNNSSAEYVESDDHNKPMWILKGIGGAYTGAETDLFMGDCIVGNDISADIIIEDVVIKKQHAKLSITAEGITYQPLNEFGEVEDEARAILIPPYRHFSIGSSVFAYGSPSTAWQVDKNALPLDLLSEKPLNEDQPEEENEDPETENSASESEDKENEEDATGVIENASEDDSDDELDDGFDDVDNPNKAKPVSTNKHVEKLRSILHNTFVGTIIKKIKLFGKRFKRTLVVICILIVGYYIFDFSHGKVKEYNYVKQLEKRSDEAYSELKMYVNKNNLKYVKVSQDSITAVDGYVLTKSEYNKVVKWINEQGYIVDLNIVVTENLKESADTLLEINGLSDYVTIEVGEKPGVLYAKGYLVDGNKWEGVRKQIHNDIPELKKMVNYVDTQSNRISSLREAVHKNGLSKQVHISNTSQGVYVLLTLDPNNKLVWEHIHSRFVKRYGNQPELQFRTTQMKGFEIKGVSLGHSPFIILSDDTRYQSGDRLPNGYTIESIESDKILFRNKGHFLSYPLQDKSVAKKDKDSDLIWSKSQHP